MMRPALLLVSAVATVSLLACDMTTTTRPSPGVPTAPDDAPAIVKGCLERSFPDVLAQEKGKLLDSSCESNDKSAEQRMAEGAFTVGAAASGADGIFTSSGMIDGSGDWPKDDRDQLAEKHRAYVEGTIANTEATREKMVKRVGDCLIVETQLTYFDAGVQCALTNDRESEKPYLAGFIAACVDSAGSGKEARDQCEKAGRAAYVERIGALRKKPSALH